MIKKTFLFVTLLLLTAAFMSGCLPATNTPAEDPVVSPTTPAEAPTQPASKPTALPAPTTEPTAEPTEPPAETRSLAGVVYHTSSEKTIWINAQNEAVELGRNDLLLSPGLRRGAMIDFLAADSSQSPAPIIVVDLITQEMWTLNLPVDIRPVGCYNWQNDNVLLCGFRFLNEEDSPNLGRLVRVDVNSGRTEFLMENRLSFSPPAVSADGRKIAFDIGDNELIVWENGVLSPFDFAAFSGGAFVPAQGVGSPSFSPEGSKLAVVFGGNPARYVVFDLDSLTAQEAAAFEPLGFGGWFPAARWSPDGTQLALHLLTSQAENGGVAVVDLVNGGDLSAAMLGASYRFPLWLDKQTLLVENAPSGSPAEYVVIDLVSRTAAPAGLPAEAYAVDIIHPVTQEEALNEEFIDAFAGVSIRYPTGWTIVDVPADIKESSSIYAVTFNQFDPNQMVGGSDGIAIGTTKFDLVVFNETFTSLEAAAEARRETHAQSELPLQVLAEEWLTLPGGLEVVRWRLDSAYAGRVTVIAAVVNDRMVLFNGFGDQALLDQMADTLQTTN